MEANPDQSPELRSEFYKKKKELTELRSKLNAISSQKENFFRELRSSRDKLKDRMSKIRTLRQERDELTKQVKELKKGRDELNLAVKETAAVKKGSDQKKKEMMEKLNVAGNPMALKSAIEKIEMRIVTEVMPFEQEEKLRKKIKELKAQFKKLEELGQVWREVHTVAVNLSDTRRRAEESHQKVQEVAAKSQEIHEQINTLYEEVKKSREEERGLAEKYLESKAQYEQLKKSLDELLQRINELGKIFGEEEKKDFRKQVQERTAAVTEKLRRKEKLSMDDILAFQATRE